MRFMVLLRGTRMFEAPAGLMEGITRLGAEASVAGALGDTAALAPSVSGARVRLTGGRLDVDTEPFTPGPELLSYAFYQVATAAEAVEWASRLLRLHQEFVPGWEGEAEILKVFGPADFTPDEAGRSGEAAAAPRSGPGAPVR